MSDAFLSIPGTKRKRPSRPNTRPQRLSKAKSQSQKGSTPHTKRRLRDTSPQDDDDEVGPGGIESDIDFNEDEQTEESDTDETPAEKRLRLAKEYIDTVKLEVGMSRGMIWLMVGNDFDAAEVDRDIISQRLQEDVAETKGKVYKHIASTLSVVFQGKQIRHKNPVTCVAQHGSYFYTACKNGVIEKWDMKDIFHPIRLAHIKREKNKKTFTAHTGDILSMAITGDGKFLATGGVDKRICIWETSTMKHLKSFTQHRGAVMVSAKKASVLTSRASRVGNHPTNSSPQVQTEPSSSGHWMT